MHVLGKKPQQTDKPKRPSAPKITKPTEQPPAADAPMDALDQFAKAAELGNLDIAIMLMFWKARHDAQPFTMDITEADIKGFNDCVQYLEVQPTIRVFRPQGKPAHLGAPATETRSAIPPRPAGKPKDYVVIQMIDQNGDAFVPIENNEADLQRGQETQRIRRIKETAPALAAQMMADLQANTTSNSTIMEAAEALKLLAAR